MSSIPSSAMVIIATVSAVVGASVALLTVWLRSRSRDDTWIHTFTNLHQEFWSDEDYQQVRSWLANDADYAGLKDVLDRRRLGRSNLQMSEYRQVDRLDKFFNLLIRAKRVSNFSKTSVGLWRQLHFQYWINRIRDPGREELWLYFREHYADFVAMFFDKKTISLT